LLTVAPAAQASGCGRVLDDFNRPVGSPLGPNWTEQAESWSIQGQKATHGASTPALATYNGASSPEACIDVTRSGDALQYGGVVLNYASVTDSRFVKVQADTNHPKFDTAFFYVGNGSGASGTPNAVALVPFAAARLDVKESGDVVTVEVDSNFDGIPDQTASSTLPAAGSGTGIGMNGYGGALLDNFAVPAADAPSSSLSPPPDTTKPTLGSLGMSVTVFRAAKSGPSASAKKKPIGTKVSFSLSEPSTVKFTVERKTRGRKGGKNCKAQTKANRKKKPCVRWVKVKGSFTRAGKAGKNSFKFRGRIGGKALKPGNYRLDAQATDPAKNKSALKRKSFKIVR
jgi:hypothetical protein